MYVCMYVCMYPPPHSPLLRSRVRALSISVALTLSVVRACTRLCADAWKMCAGEREKRIAEKGRTHQLPSSCPRRSSCTQKRLRCRHTHRQPAWFEIQNMCAVTRALIGAYGYTHQASLAAHMHVMCYIELYLISLFVTLYIYIQISCR